VARRAYVVDGPHSLAAIDFLPDGDEVAPGIGAED
jgi:hypothetical protein